METTEVLKDHSALLGCVHTYETGIKAKTRITLYYINHTINIMQLRRQKAKQRPSEAYHQLDLSHLTSKLPLQT